MNEKLKPCPFCGSEAVLTFGGERFVIPECSNCGAALPAVFANPDIEHAKQEAIRLWNSRKLSPKLEALAILYDAFTLNHVKKVSVNHD